MKRYLITRAMAIVITVFFLVGGEAMVQSVLGREHQGAWTGLVATMFVISKVLGEFDKRERKRKASKDGCEVCGGTRGGVPGNEGVVDGMVACDACQADLSRDIRPGG